MTMALSPGLLLWKQQGLPLVCKTWTCQENPRSGKLFIT